MKCKLITAFTAIVFTAAAAMADESAKPQATQDGARFMLAPSQPAVEVVIEKSEKTANDFTWGALTGNGPASGAAPVIGEGSGKAFYEFADGRPHPFYIQPPKK